ncbi:MAG TPA: A/G-specific adenine glycosylase [Bacteroidota bacterium]|nr:A/G-specific adenine glycosylase [Bacteroidota bacterium]
MRRFDRSVIPRVRRWFRRRGRTLPWRGEKDPYRVILSEIMLQQTQVQRVLEKYPLFLRRFPTMRSLARARRRDVVLAWRGMGYNGRAVRLHALAAVIVERGMRIPRDAGALRALPGIGKYTAHAILSAVHGLPVPLVDVNVRRLFSRVFWRMRSTGEMRGEAEIWEAAGSLLPRRNVYEWNQALMDLGATICTARRPRCPACPLGPLCASRGSMSEPLRRERKREPGLKGMPDRIARGRIVEALRDAGGGRTVGAIGKMIRPGFSPRHGRWLESLIRRLERDGLVRLSRRGDLLESRVTLQ